MSDWWDTHADKESDSAREKNCDTKNRKSLALASIRLPVVSEAIPIAELILDVVALQHLKYVRS